MPQAKLTMVSLVFKGRRYTKFVMLTPAVDGKLRVDENDLPWPRFPAATRGMTYTPGG